MPALNITYTDDELARLRARAKAEGRSLSALVHDVSVETTDRAYDDALFMDAAAEVMTLSRDLLKRLADR